MTPLTPVEQAAIAAYTGPITICPPHQHTERMFYANGSWQREQDQQTIRFNNKSKLKGHSTTRMVRERHERGMTTAEISRDLGLGKETINSHLRRIRGQE